MILQWCEAVDRARRFQLVNLPTDRFRHCHWVTIGTHQVIRKRIRRTETRVNGGRGWRIHALFAGIEQCDLAAMGLDHTSELRPYHAVRRVTQFQALAFSEIYDFLEPNSLVEGTANARFQGFWDQASAESFRPWSAAEQRAAAAG